MCYCVYSNAQRQGAVTNMTVGEVLEAVPIHKGNDCFHRIKVWEHKTKASFGSAHIVIPSQIYDLLSRYITLFRCKEEVQSLAFVTSAGRKVTQISEDLKALSSAFGQTLSINPTLNRKAASTKAATSLTDNDMRIVATHMSHSVTTAKKHYQHLADTNSAVTAYTMLNDPKVSTTYM